MPYKIYYDQVATGTSNTEHTFFAHNEADDGETVTNLATDNQLPENVRIQRIEFIPAQDITQADALKLTESAIIKVIVGTNEVLKFPAALAFSDNHVRIDEYVEAGSTGTTASEYAVCMSTLGGLELPEPIEVPANTKFNIKLVCGSAFGTDTNLTMVIHCITA